MRTTTKALCVTTGIASACCATLSICMMLYSHSVNKDSYDYLCETYYTGDSVDIKRFIVCETFRTMHEHIKTANIFVTIASAINSVVFASASCAIIRFCNQSTCDMGVETLHNQLTR